MSSSEDQLPLPADDDDPCSIMEPHDINPNFRNQNPSLFYSSSSVTENDSTIMEEGEEIEEGVLLDGDFSLSSSGCEKKCKCEDCGKIFNSVWYLKQHAVKHSAERPYKCKLCNKTYRFRSNLYQHKCHSRDVLGAVMYPHVYTNSFRNNRPSRGVGRCPGARPPSGLGLESNYSQQPGTSSSPRNESSLDFTNNNKTPSPRRCINLPSVTPPTPEEIKKFVEKHSDQLHKCLRCQQLFPSREYLTRHMSWHEDLDSRQKNKCSLCSEVYEDEQAYGLHKQLHVPSSPYVCQACRGKFCHRVALKKHTSKCTVRRKRDIFGQTSFDESPSNRDDTTLYNEAAMFFDRSPTESPNVEPGMKNDQIISRPVSLDCDDNVLTTPVVRRDDDNETGHRKNNQTGQARNDDHCYQKENPPCDNNQENIFDLISNSQSCKFAEQPADQLSGEMGGSSFDQQANWNENFLVPSSTKDDQKENPAEPPMPYYEHRPSYQEYFTSAINQPWFNGLQIHGICPGMPSFNRSDVRMDVGQAVMFDVEYNSNNDDLFTTPKPTIFRPLDESCCTMAVDLMPEEQAGGVVAAATPVVVKPWPTVVDIVDRRTTIAPTLQSSLSRKRPLAATSSSSNPFQCCSCASRFRSANALRDHMIRKHSSDEENQSKLCDPNPALQSKPTPKCSVYTAKRVCLGSPLSVNGAGAASPWSSSGHRCQSCGRSFRRREHLEKHRTQNHCLTAMLAITTASRIADDGETMNPSSSPPQLLTPDTAPPPKPQAAAIILVPPKPATNGGHGRPGSTTITGHRSISGATRSSRAKTLRNARPEECRCRYCPKTFFYKRYVRKHERLQHELPQERQGESSSLVYNLKNADLYKIRCPLCVKRFSSQRLLKQHLAFHERANKLLEKEKQN